MSEVLGQALYIIALNPTTTSRGKHSHSFSTYRAGNRGSLNLKDSPLNIQGLN